MGCATELTETAAESALSVPIHAARTGVTAYLHVPEGTSVSVQLVPVTVPEQLEATVAGTPEAASNRRTV